MLHILRTIPRFQAGRMAWLAILAGIALPGGCILRKMTGTEGFPRFYTTGNCIYDGTWLTTGTFELTAGQVTQAKGFVVDRAGVIFAAGFGTDSGGVLSWVVRKSADGGRAWSGSDTYQLSAGANASAKAILLAADGAIVVGGTADDGTGLIHWIARVSRDSGSTWSTLEDFVYEDGSSNQGNSALESMAADPLGGLYAAGYAFDTDKGYNVGILRSSIDGGATWTTARTYDHDLDDHAQTGADTRYSGVATIALAPSDSGFVATLVLAGTGVNTATANTEWVTQTATIDSSGPAGFGTSDVFNYATGTASTPKAIAGRFDQAGTQIVVAGESEDGSGVAHWIVRRLVTSEGVWRTVDDYALSGGLPASAASVFFDETSNRFFVSGHAGDSGSGQDTWVLRESSDFGATWATLDSFLYSTGGGSRAAHFVTDWLGARYAIGNVSDGTSSPWLFRGQACRREKNITPGGGHPVRE
ncbi:MAG: exo-alpha-sialidase [Deltaproteobacteria bacterium]|nr:exo-alpha-sialidase [Deltaproteobacteria bacterium]